MAGISKGRTCLLCLSWREDVNEVEVRDHKEGKESGSTTRWLKMHQMDSQSSDVRMKDEALQPYSFLL